jgi:hypothetical protein
VWKRQKLREQRLAVAERFAGVSSSFSVVTNWARPLEDSSKLLEQDALLVLIQVLFERKRTLDSGTALRSLLNSVPPNQLPQDDLIRALYAQRVDLLACLFAEAFDVSTEDLAERAARR